MHLIFMFDNMTMKVLQLSDQHQIIDNNQIPQIIYQQNAQPSPIQTADGQVHYIVQEDDLQNDNYNLVQQATQQVYYHKIENGQQVIQHRKCIMRKHVFPFDGNSFTCND